MLNTQTVSALPTYFLSQFLCITVEWVSRRRNPSINSAHKQIINNLRYDQTI